jgi:hypothetical protein
MGQFIPISKIFKQLTLPGNSKFGQHRAEHRTLAFRNTDDKKIIQLCFPFKKPSQTHAPTLSVHCQEFITGEGDVLTRVWRNGDKSVEWEFPPVAIVSIIGLEFPQFINLINPYSPIPMFVGKP